jgi:hypothetical protein
MAISFSAGQVLTANALNVLAPIYVPKSANQTMTSSTTLTNDAALFVALPANQVYEVRLKLLAAYASAVTSGTPLGIQANWSLTSTGALVARTVLGPSDTTAGVTGPDEYQVQGRAIGLTNNSFYQMIGTSSATNAFVISEELVITSGASGTTLQLQWAQDSSSTNTLSVLAGSYLIARAIA